MTAIDLERLVELLALEPHPEGGFFAETYRSENIEGLHRPWGTAIYYLLTPETFSTMHRLKNDEVYHFYLGDPVEMLNCFPDGSSRVHYLGRDLEAGQSLQHLVEKGVYQGSRLVPGGSYALLGTTMAPGFDFADFEEGSLSELLSLYPEREDLLRALTRKP